MSSKAILGTYESYVPLFSSSFGRVPQIAFHKSEKEGTLGNLLEGSGYIGDECDVKNHH